MNNSKSLLMERSNLERLISNVGCANGANDYRIRHVGTIKQLGSGSFFPSFLQYEKCGMESLWKAANNVCVTFIAVS